MFITRQLLRYGGDGMRCAGEGAANIGSKAACYDGRLAVPGEECRAGRDFMAKVHGTGLAAKLSLILNARALSLTADLEIGWPGAGRSQIGAHGI
jgi:hypothetical protein